jgi:hypothetical protein
MLHLLDGDSMPPSQLARLLRKSNAAGRKGEANLEEARNNRAGTETCAPVMPPGKAIVVMFLFKASWAELHACALLISDDSLSAQKVALHERSSKSWQLGKLSKQRKYCSCQNRKITVNDPHENLYCTRKSEIHREKKMCIDAIS